MSRLVNLVNRACSVYGNTVARLAKHRVILCYHNVGDAGRGWLGSSRSIPADNFEAQMRWLKANVDVVSLDEIVDTSHTIKRHQVAITFDDGYLNNVETVMPILQRLELPMTWFVATQFVDDAERLPWWDMIDLLLERAAGLLEFVELEVRGVYDPSRDEDRKWLDNSLRTIIKALPPQRRDAIARELARQLEKCGGVPANAFARPDEIAAIDWKLLEFGGHTVSHPNLAVCAQAQQRGELASNKDRLEQISGRRLNWFAYPFGGDDTFDAAAAESVRAAGFRGAVTLLPGTVSSTSNAYMLPRLAVSPRLSLDAFKGRVSGAPMFIHAQRLRKRRLQASR